MLGAAEAHGADLCAGGWSSAADCARELAAPLGVEAEALLSRLEGGEGGEGGQPKEELLWSACSEAMQALSEHRILVVRCNSIDAYGLSLLGRLVGCVGNVHIASQVLHAQRGCVSVVLRGWADDTIEADWSDEEADEFKVSALH